MAPAPIIGLLTDFGLTDSFVGVMKAVILGVAPAARLVDISHAVAPQDIEMGAWILNTAWPYVPRGCVLLCVVDPGVGSARRAIALDVFGRTFVGPDNGLFTYPLAEATRRSAPVACVSLDNPLYHRPTVSATFQGRDLFAPCAAHLAAGTPLAALGSTVDSATLTRLSFALEPTVEDGAYLGRVAHVDHYGNLITNLSGPLADAALASLDARLDLAGHTINARATHFAGGPADAPFFLRDSSGALAIVVRNGSASARLQVERGAAVRLIGLPAAPDTEAHMR